MVLNEETYRHDIFLEVIPILDKYLIDNRGWSDQVLIGQTDNKRCDFLGQPIIFIYIYSPKTCGVGRGET